MGSDDRTGTSLAEPKSILRQEAIAEGSIVMKNKEGSIVMRNFNKKTLTDAHSKEISTRVGINDHPRGRMIPAKKFTPKGLTLSKPELSKRPCLLSQDRPA